MKIIKFNTTVDINLLKEGLSNYEFYEEVLKIPHNTVRGIEKVILAKYKIDINEYLRVRNYRGKNLFYSGEEFLRKIKDIERKMKRNKSVDFSSL